MVVRVVFDEVIVGVTVGVGVSLVGVVVDEVLVVWVVESPTVIK